MAQVEIKNTKILSDEHYTLKKLEYSLKQSNGTWDEQSRQVFDHGNAVTVLLYNKEQRTVILTKQFRIATYINGNASGMLVEACAGLLEENEDPDETVKREVKEETGYEIKEIKKIYEAYTSAGSLTELLHFYVAPYNKDQRVNEGGGLKEEGEDIKVMEVAFDDAWRMAESGEMKDAKTIMLLQYALLNQLI